MREWGLFVITFGFFTIMMAPKVGNLYAGILSGFVFIAGGYTMYRKGNAKSSKTKKGKK